MSFIRILPAFALSLVACGTADKDDTSDVNFDEPSSEPAAAPTSEPPVSTTFAVDFVGGYAGLTVANSVEIVGPSILNGDNGPSELANMFTIVLAFENWTGVGDYDNACILQFSLEGGAVDDTFFNDVSNGWVGWTFPGESNFLGNTPSCDDLSEDYMPLFENFKTADFGVGLAPLTEDMENGLHPDESEVTDEEWEADFAPNYYSQFIMIDFGDFGGSSGWSGTNFAIAYEVGEDGVLSETTNDDGDTINVLLDISESTFAPDGFHYGNLGFGWGFGG
jgi:hypothetical protein